MRFRAIDFETANERRASACALGVASFDERGISGSDYCLIRPQDLDFSMYNTRIHGIRDSDVLLAPEFPEAASKLIKDLSVVSIFAHNAEFDLSVLYQTAAIYEIELPDVIYVCTADLAQRAWPGRISYNLRDLMSSLGYSFRHHHAQDDAISSAHVAIAAANTLGISDFGRLVDLFGKKYSNERRIMNYVGHRDAVQKWPEAKALYVFDALGSTKEIYKIKVFRSYERVSLRCGCRAGQSKKFCRHVRNLTNGDVDGLNEDRREQLEEFFSLLNTCQVVHPLDVYASNSQNQNNITKKDKSYRFSVNLTGSERGYVSSQKTKDTVDEKVVVFVGTMNSQLSIARLDSGVAVGYRRGFYITKNTHLVVAGPGAGSKLDKAKELGIETLSEEEWLARVGEG